MSPKYSRYIGIASYVIVKSPSKPYIFVHLFSIVLSCTVHISYSHTVVHPILASLINVTYPVANIQFKPCFWCIYIGLQYCNNTVGYSYNTLLRYIAIIITLTQSVQGQ